MNSSIAAACPYLGTRRDAEVCYSYPSASNRCYRSSKDESPALGHQSAYCLVAAHSDCPIFKEADGSVPAGLQEARPTGGRRTALRWVAVAAALVILAALGLFAGRRHWGGFAAPPAPKAKLVVPPPVAAPAKATVPQATNRPVPSETTVPTDTASPQAHTLETAILVDGQEFRMHRVAWGETFESVSSSYNTTQDVIRALNYNFVPPLRANSLIVLAPGLRLVDAGLPAFRVQEVDEAETTVEAVANELGADPALLAEYNGCAAGCRLVAGDWLLVPVVLR